MAEPTKKTALITGSTKGIGLATAKALAQLGWQVILHGRSAERCLAVREKIIAETGNPEVHFLVADLADLQQVNQLADQVIEGFPNLSVLINNAGMFSFQRQLNPDGLERTWVVNYLARFLLTKRLLGRLTKNGPSRIIDVSGLYHKKGHIHLGDPSLAENYSMGEANNQTKLANVLHTFALARRLDPKQVTVNTLHPGAVNTGSILNSNEFSRFAKALYRLMSIFLKNPEQGARTSVYLATSPEVAQISGKYFVNEKITKPSARSQDPVLQDLLWEDSMDWLIEHNYVEGQVEVLR